MTQSDKETPAKHKTMTREEFIELNSIEDGTILFEPFDKYLEAIVGISENRQHIFYDYQKLIDITAKSYEYEYYSKPHTEDEEAPDFYLDATEWVDYNMTFGGSMEGGYPILIMPCYKDDSDYILP